MRRVSFQFSESGGSLNGPDLFTELPFLYKSSPKPSFTECLPPLSLETLYFTEKCFVTSPSQKSAPTFEDAQRGEHRRGEGSETFLDSKWVLRRFSEVS